VVTVISFIYQLKILLVLANRTQWPYMGSVKRRLSDQGQDIRKLH
jgi:hypothetical protein